MLRFRNLLFIRKSWALSRNSVCVTSTEYVESVRAYSKHMNIVLQALKHFLKCSQEKAFGIYDDFPSVRSIEMIPGMKENIELLQRLGVTSEALVDNPFILIMNKGNLPGAFF